MGRTAKPWYRASRDAWYVEVGGKQVRLANGREGRQEALQAFHRLMVDRTAGRPRAGQPAAAGELILAWLDEQDRRVGRGELSARTRDWYELQLDGLAEAVGDIPAESLTPEAVFAWLDTKPGRGTTSRHHALATVRAVFRWAATRRKIPDPLAGLALPPRRQRRETVLAPEQWLTVLDGVRSAGFRELITFLHATGCRLGEAAQLEARHVDLVAGTATTWRHKTARVTGRPRVIVLPPAALEQLRRLIAARPDGPLFVTEDGSSWTKDAVNCQVRRIRDRAGLGHEFTAHALRHLFGTDALVRGVPVPVVAALMGHSTATTVARWYDHTAGRGEDLRKAAAAVRPGEGPDERQAG
jgi:integrase